VKSLDLASGLRTKLILQSARRFGFFVNAGDIQYWLISRQKHRAGHQKNSCLQ